jgi:hypothetical protein
MSATEDHDRGFWLRLWDALKSAVVEFVRILLSQIARRAASRVASAVL